MVYVNYLGERLGHRLDVSSENVFHGAKLIVARLGREERHTIDIENVDCENDSWVSGINLRRYRCEYVLHMVILGPGSFTF